jgi:hypothetical protein
LGAATRIFVATGATDMRLSFNGLYALVAGQLIRFLEFPQIELSTNIAENSMRGIAIGRRNWIHFGHQNAGPKIAAILSVIESCRRLQINPRLYLADIRPGLVSKSLRSTQTLTPSAWNTARPA